MMDPIDVRGKRKLSELEQLLFDEWEAIGRGLNDPDVELDAETFIVWLQAFRRLEALGAFFDPPILALINCLERQLMDSEEDGDCDNHDAGIDPDEVSEVRQ